MKVAQSRLEHRSWRPNVELCRDPPQFQLVKEVDLIGQSIDALLAQARASHLMIESVAKRVTKYVQHKVQAFRLVISLRHFCFIAAVVVE